MRLIRKLLGIVPKDKRMDRPQDAAVVRNAQTALRRYNKTFADLAKYDRGERPNRSLPR